MSAESGAASHLPATVGRYRISACLAGDAFGSVYAGFDPLLERPVVVKVFPLEGADPAARRVITGTFAGAMQRVGLLTHSSIVALFDAGETPESVFMATEFVDGESLAQLMARGFDLDLPLRVSLLLQVVDALEYARVHGVPHLDFKASNIRISPDLMLKVGGFGVAPVVEALSLATNLPTHPSRYAAPERVRGEPGDARSDVFSLARIALELLALTRTAADPVPGTVAALPPYLRDRGIREDDWAELFARACHPDPEERTATPAAFSLDLLMALDLGEAEARLAWETSRMLGSHADQLTVAPSGLASLGPPSDSPTITMPAVPRSTGGLARPPRDVPAGAGESETVLAPAPPSPESTTTTED
jgi:serine/threonine protein kinase